MTYDDMTKENGDMIHVYILMFHLPYFLLPLSSRLRHLSFLANVFPGAEERHTVDHRLTLGLERNFLLYLLVVGVI